MKVKMYLAFAYLFLISITTSAQTLFTYGTHAVTKNEFLQAYNKNPDTTGNKQQKIKEYLDLYINFRLKLQDAYDDNVNNNADIQSEAQNFKAQLTDNFINQQADVNQLLHEAFLRSQKDILLQQVFVPFAGIDTTDAFNKINAAYSELKKGKSFDDVAQQFAVDSITKTTKGIIGYITVFTLPYSIENIVYALPQNSFSTVYKSKIGYHIFKNAGIREALGRRKVQQLLFATPLFFSKEQINTAHKQADSVYNLLQSGTSFESLLPQFGKNYQPSDPSASIEIRVGQYDRDFENEVFKLQKPGDISKPFQTPYGFNIIKLIEAAPVSKDENNVTNTAYLQQQIDKDGRLDVAKYNLVQKWLPLMHFKESAFNKQDLWIYTDSAIARADTLSPAYKSINPNTTLFELDDKKYSVGEWVEYVIPMQNLIGSPDAHTRYEKIMHDFINFSATNYYRENIETFDPQLKDQLKEFNDANMLFYVMDKHVWSKASQDSAGLLKYYNQHTENYKWNKSISAIIISGADKATVTAVAEKIKNDPLHWRSITTGYGSSIYADSGRFETDQLPVKQPVQMEKDFQTQTEANDAGDAYTFLHVVEVYPQPALRNFSDAKGLVINDYQDALENQWIEQLKKTYPVRVNDAALANVY